jgi:hypothetical protein
MPRQSDQRGRSPDIAVRSRSGDYHRGRRVEAANTGMAPTSGRPELGRRGALRRHQSRTDLEIKLELKRLPPRHVFLECGPQAADAGPDCTESDQHGNGKGEVHGSSPSGGKGGQTGPPKGGALREKGA